MTRTKWIFGGMILAVLALAVVISVRAGPSAQQPELQGGVRTQGGAVGTGFTYRGRLESGGQPVNEDCEMAFRLYDGARGGNQVGPAITTTVPISDGLFTVVLNFGSDAFDGGARWLGIQVQCPGDAGYADLGRQALTAVPYALYALDTQGYAGVLTVAKSGGDYTSIQAAVDSISDAGPGNPYLVWVAPGVYSETVTMKPYIHLQGAGQEATVITSTARSASYPPTQATLVLTRDAGLRDLTVGNGGTGSYNVALLATAGTTRTLVTDVTAQAQGKGSGVSRNYAIHLTGSGTGVTLQDVAALAEGGSINCGLFSAASATLRGGSFTGRGGTYTHGIWNSGSGTTLEATSIIALAEDGARNLGLYNHVSASAMLHGGSFIARGGTYISFGIENGYSGATLEATSIIALAEGASYANHGLVNHVSASATLRGGSFAGREGTYAYGIRNSDNGTTLEATSVTALGEGGSTESYGLYQSDGTVRLGVTQLDGGAGWAGGTRACFQVYDGNFASITCPPPAP